MKSLRLPRVGLAALVLAVVALTWGHESTPHVEAQGTVDFSIAVDGAGCDTKGVNPTRCKVAASSQFAIIVSINDLSLVDADMDTKAGYLGMQVHLTFSAGLTLKQRAGTSEVLWPDCAFSYEEELAQEYMAGCATNIGANESVFIGQVVAVDFTCSTLGSETVSMVHGVPDIGNPVGDTHILDELAGELAEAGSESLTIHCVSVGGITELPEVAGTPLEPGGTAGIGLGLLAGMAAVIAGTLALSGAAWYGWRRIG